MSLFTAVRDIDRLRQITQVLVRHGFGEVVSRLGLASHVEVEPEVAEGAQVPRSQVGERLRLVLQDLGPTFVKLGQIISTRSDIIPADVIVELKKLQDDVAPFPEEDARRQIEETLGMPADEVFVTFEGQPLASASVAQVHRATLAVEGRPAPVAVAVKVQRPGIEDTVGKDLNLLYVLAGLVERAIPETRIYSPSGLVREFDHAINAELDFTVEAMNAARFAENFHDEEALVIPEVFAQASGKRALTLEFLDGLKVDEAVRRGADGKWIAETSVRLILKMVFEDGFFHADPHPGNILVLPRPEGERYPPGATIRIGMLDLGLVGRLSPRLRDQSVDLLMAAARQDPEAIADAILAIGRTRKKINLDEYRAHVQMLNDRHLRKKGLKNIDATGIVRDLVLGAMKFEIEIPVELTMMIRAMMTIEGVGKEIHPDLDIFAVARPYLARIIWQRYSPMRLGNELFRGAGKLSAMARDLPFQLQEILEDLRQGRLIVRAPDPERIRAMERLGRRLRATLACAALLGAGVTLVVAGKAGNLGWVLMSGAGAWMAAHLILDLAGGRKSGG